MNYRETNDECPSCGASHRDRKTNKQESRSGLETCPFCDSEKCCRCDRGDDVECPSCPVDPDF